MAYLGRPCLDAGVANFLKMAWLLAVATYVVVRGAAAIAAAPRVAIAAAVAFDECLILRQ